MTLSMIAFALDGLGIVLIVLALVVGHVFNKNFAAMLLAYAGSVVCFIGAAFGFVSWMRLDG